MVTPAPSIRNGIQVLGLTRFSVPSLGAFQVEHASLEERRAYLYDPARLAQRFAWFEHVTLPGLAAQKDPAFRLVVLLGDDFPEPWRTRMLSIVARHPQLVAQFAPPEHHRKICADAMRAHVDPEAEVVLQFRLDDDDAVAVDFTRHLRRDWRRLKALHAGSEGPIAIDYARGLNLLWRGGGRFDIVPRLERLLGVGFAIATRPGDGHFILGYMHHVIWKSMPAITIPDRIMWVRGGHGTNDSGPPADTPGFDLEPADLRRRLRRRFRIKLPDLRAALSESHDAAGAA